MPEDNQRLVQDPRERMRLGRLGLAPVFISYPRLIMPDGPGATLIELYGRYEDDLNSYVYRDCIMYCQRGGVRLDVRGEVVELNEGDFVGFASRDLVWMEPVTADLGDAPPPLALWLGAVRLGKIVAPPGKRTIVRKPRGNS